MTHVWGKPPKARKWHIFDEDDGRSLCGNYGFFGTVHTDAVEDGDTFKKSRDCTGCARKAGLTD